MHNGFNERERESGNGKRDRGIGVSSSDIYDNLNVAGAVRQVGFFFDCFLEEWREREVGDIV
jgi:hypothetical protein